MSQLSIKAARSQTAGAPALRSAVLLPSAGEIAAFTAARAPLLADGYTDSCRLCARHESSSDSLTIDLMGDTLLLQTWREPLADTVSPQEIVRLADDVSSALSTSTPLKIFLSHRGRGIKAKSLGTDSTYAALQAALGASEQRARTAEARVRDAEASLRSSQLAAVHATHAAEQAAALTGPSGLCGTILI